jgi:predicted permease
VESLFADLRYALRTLSKRPGFTLVAVLSLGLGVGANTTIFSLVDALLLRSLPVADPPSLVRLYTVDARNPAAPVPLVSHLNWKDYRQNTRAFAGILGYDTNPVSVSTGGDAFMVTGQLVSDNFFDLLGVRAALGRTFTREEGTLAGARPVVVVSDHFWRQQLGASRAALGQDITLNRHRYTVVGVAPAAFTGADLGVQIDLWVPMSMNHQISVDPENNWYETRRGLFIFALARLRPGVARAAAQAEMTGIARQLEQAYPKDNHGRTVKLLPLAQATLPLEQRDNVQRGSLLLLAVVALVLLIACANVANLLLARSMARQREIAVRLSQGARRGRLVRQLLTESLVLALLGGAVGLLLMLWADRLLVTYLAGLPNPVALDLAIDARVLGFALAVSLATGLVFGLVPALQSTRPQLVTALKTQAGSALALRRGGVLREALVIGEVALSLLALIAAGLFLRSLTAAQHIDPGFDTRHLFALSFDIGLYGLDDKPGEQLLRTVREQVAALPGMKSVALAQAAPLQLSVVRSVFLEGRDNPDDGVLVQTDAVDPSFFRTVSIPILAGRPLADGDRAGGQPVAVVNQTLAEKFWPRQSAVGQRFHFFNEKPIEVVGVARNAKYTDIAEASQPYVYMPLAQHPVNAVTLLGRSAGSPAAALAAAGRRVRQLAPGMPLVGAGTVTQQLDASLWLPRLVASLLTLFGALALVLAAIGIYGVMSVSVAQRARDIGIRMALGAQRESVLAMILRRGMIQVAIGLALGFAAAFALTRLAAQLLIGISPTDPVAFLATPVLLALVALVSLYVPARRATRVNPIVTLRSE